MARKVTPITSINASAMPRPASPQYPAAVSSRVRRHQRNTTRQTTVHRVVLAPPNKKLRGDGHHRQGPSQVIAGITAGQSMTRRHPLTAIKLLSTFTPNPIRCHWQERPVAALQAVILKTRKKNTEGEEEAPPAAVGEVQNFNLGGRICAFPPSFCSLQVVCNPRIQVAMLKPTRDGRSRALQCCNHHENDAHAHHGARKKTSTGRSSSRTSASKVSSVISGAQLLASMLSPPPRDLRIDDG